MPQPEGPAAEDKKHGTILIVDDEMDMRIFISALFKAAGFTAVACRNGKEGLETTAEINPDLIVLDVMMPGQGGALMYKALKADKRFEKIPVIMLSAVEERSFVHYLKMLNIKMEGVVPDPDAYIEKPPDADHLVKTARRLING